MISRKWQYPHPVLADGQDDYTEGSFTLIEGEHVTKESSFVFCFSYCLSCQGMEQYIAHGKANVILFASSSAAKFRKRFLFPPGQSNIRAEIPQNDIVRTIEFKAYVLAEGDPEFSLPEHNRSYYAGASFALRKGDILAESATIAIDLDDSELQKPLSSIFEIKRVEAICREKIAPDFDGEKICVALSPETYDSYDFLKSHHLAIRRNLSAVITMPVLVDAIEIMRSDGAETYQGCRWYRSLLKKMEQVGIDIEESAESSTAIANYIYGDIVFDAFDVVKKLLSRIEDNNEFTELGGID